ncbi:hypothetical protein ACHAPU_008246 [Fusarium lateritium]
MAYATGARDSMSTRSGGGSMDPQFSAATRAPGQNSLLTLTASSASSVSSGSQQQSGGVPGTPASRRSGGWDRQTISPAAAARIRVDDVRNPEWHKKKVYPGPSELHWVTLEAILPIVRQEVQQILCSFVFPSGKPLTS